MKKGNLIYILILSLLILNSCSSNSDIEIEFINKTNYNIDKFVFSLTHQSDSISLEKNMESETFRFRYDMPWAELFSDPMLNLWVRKYSDSSGIYTPYTGRVIGRSQLDKKKLNQVLILTDSVNGDFIFRLKK